jgi:hypothetical protein
VPTPSLETAARHAALIHLIGGEAWVVPVPSLVSTELCEVGRFNELPCWSAEFAPRLVRETARKLARQGHIGLLFADDPVSGCRTLAVTVAPVQAVVLTEHTSDALVLSRLARITPRDNILSAAIACSDALDVDAAGRAAFSDLRGCIGKSVDALGVSVPRRERHAWVLLQVTRLLFLRFVESEGWLDSQPDFLRLHIDRVLHRKLDPGRHLFRPLFFGTLNRPANDRSKLARDFGTIPFLNGGLFEPHPVERRRDWQLPSAMWREILNLIVERIEVSLDAKDHHGRVTPELLGRVFEGVMAPEERRDAGAFFTPPQLVTAIVRQSLACHLAPVLSRSEVAVFDALDQPDPGLQQALLRLRILDPAVGSGAFLVGALQLLRGPLPQGHRFTRGIVSRRLFGVDRNPAAVRLTELRLWLEVLRSMRGRPASRVSPLPNLDATVRAGDALIDPLGGHGLGSGATKLISGRRRAVTNAHGSERRKALKLLRTAERAVLDQSLEAAEVMRRIQVADFLAAARSPTLFGGRVPPTAAMRRTLAELREVLRNIRRARRKLRDEPATAAFAIETAFAPVLARGGFDMVVGNPPWVRGDRIPKAMRSALTGRFRWWRGSGTGWRHAPDLSVAFIERSVELLCPTGTLALLVPAKIATASYAATCRAELATRSMLHHVADLTNDTRADFEATTYPLALIASKRTIVAEHPVRLTMRSDGPSVPQQLWRESSGWSFADPEFQVLISDIKRRHPKLGDQLCPSLGVKTGANAVFLNPPDSVAEWCRSAVRGRDVSEFSSGSRTQLLWPADARGKPLARLPPALMAYLSSHRNQLERRADQVRGPWWQLFRTGPATAEHRVIWADLSRRLEASVLHGDALVPLNSCYVIALPSATTAAVLAAWLNCGLIRELAKAAAEPARGGYARFGARVVQQLPLPANALQDPTLISLSSGASPPSMAAFEQRMAELLGTCTLSR